MIPYTPGDPPFAEALQIEPASEHNGSFALGAAFGFLLSAPVWVAVMWVLFGTGGGFYG